MILPREPKYSRHSYHLYVIRVNPKKRDKIIEELRKENIFLGIYYPVPCHLQKVVLDRFERKKLLNTEKRVKEIISLPMYPNLTDDRAVRIAKLVKKLA
ncbi:hypothetical protein COU62_03870 [Candidatus Pacearchaeota archaeon CG10_big_fil_rev_8_21_14_0_10_35_219]|nr:DegT/DnrJ/EryC1/StrS aminotransferase family protein [Candidatus Pacearchaeota archaeon]PIO07488.1 MAG: hypothetical protein COU62_03870 [Candidatus Pacearchaeota archaeon CG10_big_fil_rev_8_21_14_0_10_35_219]PIY81294.1 MAG: hypothetical protein COY79_03365 [Candidatus Pacearchaeota archaeon CG_4_10_14_0_8_um_filter_35_169]PIZ80223.1 MAG: hypothetical protein COY00_02010 [Candidatus Pacearchaeota archaeon CG_4_10_14_0_2_um_filter_35_33]PJA69512.1 MAG: hypothetical protein CO155_04535 [Candid